MFKSISIKVMLGLFLFSIGAMAIIYGGMDLLSAHAKMAAAESVVRSSEASRIVLKVLLNTRLERGMFGRMLSNEAAADQSDLAKTLEYRKLVEDNYEALLKNLQKGGNASIAATLPALEKAHADMVAGQAQFDRDSAVNKAARSASSLDDSQNAYQNFLTALTETADRVDGSINRSDALIAHYLDIKRYAWQVRVRHGGNLAKLQGAIASNATWTPAEIEENYEARGRALAAWTALSDEMKATDLDPSVIEAFKKAGENNFSGQAWTETDGIYKSLAAGQPVVIDIKDLQKRNTAATNLIVDVASIALDKMVARAEQIASKSRQGMIVSFGVLVLSLVLLIGGIVAVRVWISGPLLTITSTMLRLANGDSSAEVQQLDTCLEIVEMTRSVVVFRENLIRSQALEAEAEKLRKDAEVQRRQTLVDLADDLEVAVGTVVTSVSASATQMEATAREMSRSAEMTLQQSTVVAASAEEASASVSTVAAAAEELGASVDEINRQVEQSALSAQTAVDEARSAAQIITQMEDSAQTISTVVDLISEIASQTNLLALNATIEAARSGEAGKGFAVVASEVKQLASQTANATSDIGGQIKAIQETSTEAAKAIARVVRAIEVMSMAAQSIVGTIDQQSLATREIVQSVSQAALGTKEVSAIISDVAKAADNTGAGAAEVRTVSSQLDGHASELNARIQNFLSTLRAA